MTGFEARFAVLGTDERGRLGVLEQVRRHELNRAGSNASQSDAFAGASVNDRWVVVGPAGHEAVLGTMRMTPVADLIDVTAACNEYRLDTLPAGLVDRAIVLTRLALLPEARASEAGLSLYRYAFESDIELVLLSCEPGLVGLYESLGARVHGRAHCGSRGGFRVPMVFVIRDHAHFEATGSPVVPDVDGESISPDSAAADWLATIAPSHAGIRPIAQDDLSALSSLLDGLSSPASDALLAHSMVVETRHGELVVAAGDGGRHLGVVLSGSVTVTVDGTTTLDQFSRGDLFGELAFTLGSRRTADVETAEDGTRVVLLSQRAFDRVAETDTGADLATLWHNVARVLARRLLDRTGESFAEV